MAHYDIIGDIHGHAGELRALLEKLGYRRSGHGFRHDERQVVFVGDFIDPRSLRPSESRERPLRTATGTP
ncbi:MAG: metallophosphoesterase [Woeseiales bacterium]